MPPDPYSPVLSATARIAAAYASSNPKLGAGRLPEVVQVVHAALAPLTARDSPPTTALTAPPKRLRRKRPIPAKVPAASAPAVPVAASIQPDHLVCLEDGRSVVLLKRYLREHCGLEPEEYRERWGLPPDYPMVPPNYAARRSAIAQTVPRGSRR